MRDRLATKSDLDDMRKEMATKSDLKKIETRLMSVESKLAGIDKRLDIEAGIRSDLKVSERVADLESKVFSKSRQPELSK